MFVNTQAYDVLGMRSQCKGYSISNALFIFISYNAYYIFLINSIFSDILYKHVIKKKMKGKFFNFSLNRKNFINQSLQMTMTG